MTNELNARPSARGRMRVYLLAALFLLALPLAASAQEAAPTPFTVVRGTVRDCAGQPVPGVTVVIVGGNGSVIRVTNSIGEYRAVLAEGTYTVTPTPSGRYFFSPPNAETEGFGADDFTRYPRDNRANFDGDCKSDVSDFNRGSGEWRSLNSTNGQLVSFYFGTSADVLTPGDYDGDGRTDRAVFRPGNATWYVATDTSGAFYGVQFGVTSDLPVAGDYDGDARTDHAVFRPSNGFWYIRRSDGTFYGVPFGQTADIPAPGDYDGDGRTDIAVFRPGTGDWHFLYSSGGTAQVHWGQAGDSPVQADYDGDGRADIAVFRPGPADWYILNSSDGQTQSVHWGQSGDRPAPADYDGDGRADIAIQRLDSTSAFWILPSATGSYYAVSNFGEFPVPLGYLSPRSQWY
ncbi:MAG TPA: FG-GAP-like repeat-containing protein [Pyrinomonadaceae bacterium]